jgi:YgiT-type zinc finger domain-containing protein
MERGPKNEEETFMKCQTCGAKMSSIVTDLPFKRSETTIVILKGLPVSQCENCSEYLLDDSVLQRVEKLLERVDTSAELEILRYAA